MDRDAAALERAENEVDGRAGHVSTRILDVTDEAGVGTAVEAIAADGPIAEQDRVSGLRGP